MLIVRLREMMGVLQRKRRAPVTLAEVANSTGIHRKIISRIHNRPATPVKGETLDQLAQFFFVEFLRCEDPGGSMEGLMTRVVQGLVVVYPDNESFQRGVLSNLDVPAPKNQGELAGRLRCKAAFSLWSAFEALGKPEIEARRRELLEETKLEKPKPNRRKVKSRRATKSRQLFG